MMRHEKIYHRGDTNSEGKVVHECTLRERPKRLLLHSQTNDGRNTTTYLTQAFVCERAYYNFFHEKMGAISDEKMNEYMQEQGM